MSQRASRPMTGCASSALSDRGDNALQLAGDGFGDRLQRRISNMLHGYGRVDGGYLDPAAADILHDDVAWQHRSDLVIGGQRLVRQRRVTRAEDPILPEIEVELFLHRRFDIDFSQNAKALGFERLDVALYRDGEGPAHGLGDIVFHLNTSADPRPQVRWRDRRVRYCGDGQSRRRYRGRPERAQARRSLQSRPF